MATVAATNYEDRENIVVQAAATCIENSSLLEFTMAAISKAAGLSMGSIYKHIQCKEDVLLALGCRCSRHFEALVHTIMALPLPIVARLVAIRLVDVEHTSPYRFGPELSTLLASEAILRRASLGWLDKYFAAESAIETLYKQHLRLAVQDRALAVTSEAQIDEINTATWSLCVGHLQVERQRSVRHDGSNPVRLDSDSMIMRALQRMLNTWEWEQPLTDEVIRDTCSTLERAGLREARG